MTSEEFVKLCGQVYMQELEKLDDADYVVNQPQMNKLLDVCAFFIQTAKRCGGRVEPIALSPRELHGGVNAQFEVFDVSGDEVQRFCQALSYTTAISMDVTADDEVYISVTVPNVFVEKKA